MNFIYQFILVMTISITTCCSTGNNAGSPDNGNDDNGDQIFITDRTGKKWDVTHAVENYGFDINNFQYGLGPFAITPINNPEMLSDRDSGYPSDNSTEAVIGLNIEGDTRAYSIRILSRHEVVNDRVGGKDVAVVY